LQSGTAATARERILTQDIGLDGLADNTTGKQATASGLFSLPNQSLRRSPNSNQLC
jgi:hypothetical protein